MLTVVRQQLQERQLLPGEHLADSGYPSAELIIHAARVFGITLVSPLRLDNSAQARAGAGYDKAAFAFDFDARQATCPQGIASSTWTPCRQRHEEAIVVSWPATACLPCPARQLCTSGRRRQITIRPRELHEALASARTQQTSAQWKARYNARAGVEGTMRQATHVTGIRRARYPGLPKTQLEHNIAAAAINMIRMDAYWTGHPLDRTRSSHLARLDFTLTGLLNRADDDVLRGRVQEAGAYWRTCSLAATATASARRCASVRVPLMTIGSQTGPASRPGRGSTRSAASWSALVWCGGDPVLTERS
jgi:hypothetical protein